jgi:penicillin-insensitive murein endopeptidase
MAFARKLEITAMALATPVLIITALAMFVTGALPAAAAPASVCYGTSSHGRLQDAVQLPASGKNFVSYSPLGTQLGRTWVHAAVAQVLLASWQQLETTAPGITYVYGETGHQAGGPMPPHRTHEAGIAVDFMVPVREASGRPVRLPASASDKYGYAWEFGADGKAGALTIDYEALGEHLFQLARTGKRLNVPVGRIIFDPRLMPALFNTRHGAALKALPFMLVKPWIRHDEHYHVDFGVPCRPFDG